MTVVTGIQFNQSQHAVSHSTDALLTESGCLIALTPIHSQTNLQHKLMCVDDNRCLWTRSITARVCRERTGSVLKFKGPMSGLYNKGPEWASLQFRSNNMKHFTMTWQLDNYKNFVFCADCKELQEDCPFNLTKSLMHLTSAWLNFNASQVPLKARITCR